jgi:hypothetical protein
MESSTSETSSRITPPTKLKILVEFVADLWKISRWVSVGGKPFLRLLCLRPLVEDEIDSVTWATGSVKSPGPIMESARTCGQCGDWQPTAFSKRRLREHAAQRICIPGVGWVKCRERKLGREKGKGLGRGYYARLGSCVCWEKEKGRKKVGQARVLAHGLYREQ